MTGTVNFEIIAKRWPVINKLLRSAPLPSEVVLTKQHPVTTLFIDGIHLSSEYDPVREAELQASLVPAGSASAWVYGVGAGDIPRVLLKRPLMGKVVVVIMNYSVAAQSF